MDAEATTLRRFYAGIGSRETPDTVLADIIGIAEDLANLGFWLRSGGAPGADTAFEHGANIAAVKVGGTAKKEIYLPWKKFNGSDSPLFFKDSKEAKAAMMLAEQYHPAWHQCSYGAKLLHARNGCQVLGKNLDQPVDFVVCWTKAAKDGGGTGQALRIARALKIPIFNLAARSYTAEEIVSGNW